MGNMRLVAMNLKWDESSQLYLFLKPYSAIREQVKSR